jgi:phosphate transport system substrate-binding protein
MGCGREAGEPRSAPTTLRIHSGIGVLAFLNPVAHEYQKAHPEVVFKIEAGMVPAIVTRFVDKGDTDLGALGRRVKREEFEAALKRGKILHMTAAVGDSVAVPVHAKNPIADISLAQLKAVFFTGAIHDWAELTGGAKTGPIHVLVVDQKLSALAELFGNFVSRGSPWVASATVVGLDKIPGLVHDDPDAIGFAPRKNAADLGLKILSVNAVAPGDLTVLNETYPLSRRLYWLTDGPPTGPTAEFIKYALSEPAQRLARAEGFTPLSLEN